MHIVVTTDVAAALIRLICKMQLSFRLDKRPGESHLALDGKKALRFLLSRHMDGIGGGGVGWANKVHVCSRNYVMLR